MVNTYVLINPYVQGNLKTNLKAKNSIEAGKVFYKSLSEHFNNNIPKFYFTIQKGTSGNGKYYSFKVKESRENNDIDFSFEPVTIKNEKEAMKEFNKKLQQFKVKNENQEGGAKKSKSKKSKPKKSKPKKKTLIDSIDDSDLLDNSSSDYYSTASTYVPNYNYPIHSWWYDPYLYRLNSVYIPTFYAYVTPYIQISL